MFWVFESKNNLSGRRLSVTAPRHGRASLSRCHTGHMWHFVTLRDTVTLGTNYYKRLLLGQYGYLPSAPRLGTRPAASELKHISDSFKVTQIVKFRCSRKHITSSTSILDSTHMGISSKWMWGWTIFATKNSCIYIPVLCQCNVRRLLAVCRSCQYVTSVVTVLPRDRCRVSRVSQITLFWCSSTWPPPHPRLCLPIPTLKGVAGLGQLKLTM